MPGNTPFLNLYLPGGGSTGLYGADETADIDRLNENFDKIDDFALLADSRLDALELNPIAEVLLNPSGISNTGGSSSLTARRAIFTGVTEAHINGVFSATFKQYRLIVRRTSSAAAVDLQMRKRNAGVTDSSATHSVSAIFQAGAGTGVSNANATASAVPLSGGNTTGSYSESEINDPFGSGKTTLLTHGYDDRPTVFIGGGSFPAGAHDGLTLRNADGSVFSAEVMVFGVRG